MPFVNFDGGFFVDHDSTGDGNYWLGIRFPLFRWNGVKYRQEKAQIMSQSLENKKLDTRRELHICALQALSILKNLKKILILQEERLKIVTNRLFKLPKLTTKPD